MRYFFHIVDRYGLLPDVTGCDCADHGAAVLHAGRIATELAKAGEFFRSSVVFVARTAVSKPSPARGQDLATPIAKESPRPEVAQGDRSCRFPALAAYRESPMCERESGL